MSAWIIVDLAVTAALAGVAFYYAFRMGYSRGKVDAHLEEADLISTVADNGFRAGFRAAEIAREAGGLQPLIEDFVDAQRQAGAGGQQ